MWRKWREKKIPLRHTPNSETWNSEEIRLRVGLKRNSSQVPVSDLGVWRDETSLFVTSRARWQTSLFVTFCHFNSPISYFSGKKMILSNKKIFFCSWWRFLSLPFRKTSLFGHAGTKILWKGRNVTIQAVQSQPNLLPSQILSPKFETRRWEEIRVGPTLRPTLKHVFLFPSQICHFSRKPEAARPFRIRPTLRLTLRGRFLVKIEQEFRISKYRGEWDLGLYTTSILANTVHV